MKNAERWKPTKFAPSATGWTASEDAAQVAPSSRLTASLAAKYYVAAIDRHARGHLLDLGSGQAPLYGAYRSLVTEVTCVDWPGSPHDTSHVDIFADLNQPLALPSDSYDTILSSSVLEHIWNHALLWKEMGRVLRPGGALLLGTPFLYWLHEEPHDFFRWTSHALRRASEEAGLEVVELQTYGGALDVIADLAIKATAAKSGRLAGVLHAAAKAMLSGGPLRRFSDASGAKMPLGHMIVARKPL